MRRNLVTTAIVVVGLVLATTSAFAAKGGHGGKGGSGSATLTASPSAVVSGASVELSGCGYEFEPVELDVTNNATGATQIYWAGMFASGCFSTAFTAGAAGSYTINAIQHSSANGTVKASASLVVS